MTMNNMPLLIVAGNLSVFFKKLLNSNHRPDRSESASV